MTTISVIIPTFDRQARVAEAIQSVLDQDYTDLEILVIDDGSQDGTRKEVAKFGESCRYVFQVNQGPSAARNTGLELANGDLLSFLDSDDVWLPGKIRTELQLFERYPNIEAIAGNAESYVEDKLRTASVFSDRKIGFSRSELRLFCWSLPIMRLGPSCIMSALTIKKTVLERIGAAPFDESLRFDEDWDFEFKLFSRCEALLDQQIYCRKRAYDDGTRRYYSIWGKQKSDREWRAIWQTQIMILERYLGQIDWGVKTEESFTKRRDELLLLLDG